MSLDFILVYLGVTGIIACSGYMLMQAFDRYHVMLDARLREVPNGGSRPHRFRRRNTSATHATSQEAPTSYRGVLNHLVPNRDADRQRHQSRLLQAGIFSAA